MNLLDLPASAARDLEPHTAVVTRNSLPLAQFGQDFVEVFRLASVGFFDGRLDLAMQRSSLVIIQLVTTARQDVAKLNKLDDFALRQIGRLVQDEPTIPDTGLQR